VGNDADEKGGEGQPRKWLAQTLAQAQVAATTVAPVSAGRGPSHPVP